MYISTDKLCIHTDVQTYLCTTLFCNAGHDQLKAGFHVGHLQQYKQVVIELQMLQIDMQYNM